MVSDQKTKICGNLELVELSYAEKKLHRLKNHIQKNGVITTLLKILTKMMPNRSTSSVPTLIKHSSISPNGEVLNLQPGEWVEIKTPDEVEETLDSSGKHRGLSFMPEMWKYCGGRYRVYKRVNQIVIIGTESMKKLKNTVLLEGVLCDGSDHSHCDNSCFHYWREAWLRRVPEPANGQVTSGDDTQDVVKEAETAELSAGVQ